MQVNQINQLNIPNPNIIDNNFNNQYLINNIYPEGDLSEEEDLQNLNMKDAQIDYATDSDIEDPKYMPTGNIPQMENNIIENENNYDNINIGVPSQNEILLQNEIANLENKSMIANKTLQQLESENDQLKAELMKKKETIQSKEGINNEFKQLFAAFKQRFAQYEQRNNYLQKYANELEIKQNLL